MRALSLFLIVAYILSCSPQTAKDDPVTQLKDIAQVSDEDTPVSLNIDDGLAKGSGVEFPPGALAIGSQVSLDPVQSPIEFQSQGYRSASASIKVSALDRTGGELTQADVPLVVLSLPRQPMFSRTGLCLIKS